MDYCECGTPTLDPPFDKIYPNPEKDETKRASLAGDIAMLVLVGCVVLRLFI